MALRMPAKALLLTFAFAALGFALQGNGPLGQILWPPAPHGEAPTGALLAGFIGYGLFEALGFGVGVAFLLLGYPVVRRVSRSAGWATAAHLAITWTLVNWVPHDALHMHIGMDMAGLLALEWGFHGTLMAAGATLVAFLARGVAIAEAPGRHSAATAPSMRPVAGK